MKEKVFDPFSKPIISVLAGKISRASNNFSLTVYGHVSKISRAEYINSFIWIQGKEIRRNSGLYVQRFN